MTIHSHTRLILREKPIIGKCDGKRLAYILIIGYAVTNRNDQLTVTRGVLKCDVIDSDERRSASRNRFDQNLRCNKNARTQRGTDAHTHIHPHPHTHAVSYTHLRAHET